MANVSSSNGLEKRPKLRFPGSDEPWKAERLSDFADRVTRKNSQNQTDLPLTISSKDGLVDQVSYFNKTVASKDMSGYYLLLNGEYAYNKSYSVGYDFGSIKRLDRYTMGALSTLYICFALKKHDSDFINAYFDSLKWYREIYKISAEGARNHGLLNVPTDAFFETKHYLPQNLNEQRKIADFMIALEHRIDAQQSLVDNLKKYKRGVSNAIFSRKIRFKQKDGTEYPEWDTKQLSELMEFKNGVNAQKDAFLKGNIKCIGVSDVYSGKPIYSCNIMGSIKLDSDQKREFLVEYGDVLFQRSSETQEDIGHAAVYVDESQMSVFNGFVIRGKKKAEYDPWFLHYELQTSDVRKQTIRLGAGAQHYNIGQESLASIIVRLPSADEQNKIAHLLKSIDARITVEESKIKTLQMAKDGLMQKLFV